LLNPNQEQRFVYPTGITGNYIIDGGERDEKWITTKIESAMKRMERRERNIAAEVAAFVGVTSGDFSVTECDKFLNLVTTVTRPLQEKHFKD
jgi:hypothetical protein